MAKKLDHIKGIKTFLNFFTEILNKSNIYNINKIKRTLYKADAINDFC